MLKKMISIVVNVIFPFISRINKQHLSKQFHDRWTNVFREGFEFADEDDI